LTLAISSMQKSYCGFKHNNKIRTYACLSTLALFIFFLY